MNSFVIPPTLTVAFRKERKNNAVVSIAVVRKTVFSWPVSETAWRAELAHGTVEFVHCWYY